MYKSLPWEEDITRADAMRRAGTTPPLRGFYCFQFLKKGERGGKSDSWSVAEATRVGLDALFVHRFVHGEKEGRR